MMMKMINYNGDNAAVAKRRAVSRLFISIEISSVVWLRQNNDDDDDSDSDRDNDDNAVSDDKNDYGDEAAPYWLGRCQYNVTG